MQILSTSRPSDRKFGFTFAAILIGMGTYGALASWTLIVAGLCILSGAAFLILAASAPYLLAPLNKVWFALGELLGRVVSPIVLGLIFFVLITPTSIIARLLGRDELRLKRRAVPSYWVVRQQSVLDPSSFKQQF